MLGESAFERGVRLLAAGQSEAALEQFKASLAAADAAQRADSLYNIAICHVRLGRTDEAVRCVSEAVAADPHIIAEIAADEDFAPLRVDAGFERMLERPKPASEGSSQQSEPAPTPQLNTSYASSFGKYGGYAGFAAMFAFPRAGGALASAIVGAVCGGGGAGLGAAVGSFFDAIGETPTASGTLPDKKGVSVASLVLGIVGLVAWFIPLIGLPVTITGFALGRQGRLSSQRAIALTGMGLSVLGLLLSAVNAYLGAMWMVRAGLELRR